jgi:hypothetical protein
MFAGISRIKRLPRNKKDEQDKETDEGA